MRGLLVAAAAMIAAAGSAAAADSGATLPTKSPPQAVPAAYDWGGFYVGAHYGYAGGSSRWSATQAGAAASGLSGSLGMFNGFDPFAGTGSYLHGLQGGYNYMLPSRLVVGAEADISFPSLLAGSESFSSPESGMASYRDQVTFSGTLRGRIGYAPGNWLFYVTGGLAYGYDRLTRTQLSGVPAGGAAQPGTVDNSLAPRVGAAAGAGVELALSPKWMARLEFLYTDYGSVGVDFPDAAESFKANLDVTALRAGLDYKLGENGIDSDVFAKGTAPLELDRFAVDGETTFIEQYAPPFHAPYRGANSLAPDQGRESWDETQSVGFKLWQGAEFWIDPEVDQGFGLSNTEGVAGFVNGAAAKVGASVPYPRVQRYFLRQTVDLGGKSEKIDGAADQFAATRTADRLVITVGKYAVTDIFDKNKYANDPRKDFMNWALIDTGTFDYAADAWGYSYGAAAEWYRGDWTLRGGLFDLSIIPNDVELDPGFDEFQWIGEVERRYQLWGRPGKIAITGFLSRGRMGTFADAIALAQTTGAAADIAAVRKYRSRPGLSANLEQEITSDLGVFARAGWADGNVEPYEYADIDRTVAAGLQLKGTRWGRPNDTFGLAGVVNAISGVHEAFLNNGGLGILVGDGMLPHPGLEQIIEAYYAFPVLAMTATLDYQFIVNPAYNEDRGPVSVIGTRLHYQF